jgi:hypothetical protein
MSRYFMKLVLYSILPPPGTPPAEAASKGDKTPQFPVLHFPVLNVANSHSKNSPAAVSAPSNPPIPAKISLFPNLKSKIPNLKSSPLPHSLSKSAL